MNSATIKTDFLDQMGNGAQIAHLFDHLPETYFFGKNRDGEFVFANQAIIAALGIEKETEILGKTDFDLFDGDLARKYRDEDRLVMQSGEPLVNQVWLVPHQDGTLHWYLSSKRPLFSESGKVIGIAGVMRDFEKAGSAVGPYRKLSPVLERVQSGYSERLTVDELAELAGVSVSTLERTFRKLFSVSPTGYLTRVRLHAAKRALLETDESINSIALDCGFYDQSHFTKKFRAAFGQTPSKYRHGSVERGEVGGI
jgi:PAS domain S-box-containing protein